ncbi:class I SAM-dependent methyltransferase [Asticcacaulis sp.]|uniref:class I SAM-dependent methyltransferase n=1 Tax=Asticcacaulis sp. TaxID=1872648 RepID=UPI002D0FD265|nr:50S ribosomal protein L11 methyltransferase [Asticcacaulis sp.]HTM81718.1 50S ribosomal protein L11 methyltransferase [Asticcacaulis sp.]
MSDTEAFIRAQTRPLPVSSVPSIRLYQADEVTPLWLMTEQDMATQHLAPPFWAFAWSGGQALARYILEHPEIVRGRQVLDIACGSGLVGIAARLAGAQSVLCNDIDAYAGVAAALNAELNNVELAFTGDDLLAGPIPDVDIILAGDICYEKPMTDAMLTYFRRAAPHKIEVYIGDPHRTYFPKTGLIRLADYDILTNADIEDAAVKPASVWKLES